MLSAKQALSTVPESTAKDSPGRILALEPDHETQLPLEAAIDEALVVPDVRIGLSQRAARPVNTSCAAPQDRQHEHSQQYGNRRGRGRRHRCPDRGAERDESRRADGEPGDSHGEVRIGSEDGCQGEAS